LVEDVNKVHDGTGDKLGSALQFIAGFIAGLVLGYNERNYFIFQILFLDLDWSKDGN
jgi:hypothetical protein